MVAAIFFGKEVFSFDNYSWIAILVNVPATLFATGYYELVLRDSLQKLGKGAAVHEDGHEGLAKHFSRVEERAREEQENDSDNGMTKVFSRRNVKNTKDSYMA